MFERTLSKIQSVVIHYVGNPLKDDALKMSDKASGMDVATENQIWNYLSSAFKAPDFYQFFHTAGLDMNPVYDVAKKMFLDKEKIVEHSAVLAKLLYDNSQHPNIKSGELFVIYFEHLTFGNITADAIGIFKSEKKQPFLFTESSDEAIDVFSYHGISPFKVDKACLILNDDAAEGFNVLAVDNLNKGEEARFWFDDFLKIQPRATAYHKTASMLKITKDFIERDLVVEEAFDKTESIDLLNKSINYFKEEEQFDYDGFNEKVFQNEETMDRFKAYTAQQDKVKVDLGEPFDISDDAVKKKQRIFKSVVKLDKNFHVYIHGNRDLIEKGTDENGKKYYKLYFEEEQ